MIMTTKRGLDTSLIMHIFDEASSDPDSAASDNSSNQEGDSRNSSYALSVPEDVPEMSEQLHASGVVQCSFSVSKDDVPLGNRYNTNNNLIWEKNITSSQVKYFNEKFGANIRDTCGTPVDMFHCLFTEDIINHLMYQTNLYAFQKQGGGLQFQPATAKK